MATEITNLAAFIAWIEELEPGQYLFRGVSNETYEIIPSAYRRPQMERDPEMLLRINKAYIDDARLRGLALKDGRRLTDLELLAELHHSGAATCLIDFTRSAQVALWFACAKGETNGKVNAVRVDNLLRFKKITPELLDDDIDCFFIEDERGRYPLYQWQPRQQNSRILAQQSVFLFGGDTIEAGAECVIRGDSKKSILTSLEKAAGIREAMLFPDFDGFARLRAYDKPVEPDRRGELGHGLEGSEESQPDEAIAAYDGAIDAYNEGEQK